MTVETDVFAAQAYMLVTRTPGGTILIPSIGADLMGRTWISDIRTWSAPDLADDGVTLVPNEAEQAVLADILTMREAGETLQGITDALTKRGVPTKTGNTTWNLWTVRGILKRAGVKRGQPAA